MDTRKKLIIGISGASGCIYGIRLLETVQSMDIETHLIISRTARIVLQQECGISVSDVEKLATRYHSPDDLAACISSGSYSAIGMIIAPCSIRTMSEIATGITSSLMSRAADVTLKERRKCVLMLRETPLHTGHLRQMLAVSEMGGIIMPPAPAFYNNPQNINDIVNHTVGRALDLFDINTNLTQQWEGLQKIS